ncbi:MAG: ABC transporter permease [Geodermatophilaceae bacterium]|nr:ABC transporter permease [Geodermatophilaceae bacterium]
MTTTATRRTALPSLGSVSKARVRAELLSFFREKEAVVFVLLFPVILLVVFGAVFGGNDEVAPGVPFIQYFVAGMIAAGLLSASFQNLAIQIPIERDTGYLKRLSGTPMPKAAYFIGKVVLVGFVAVVQTALLMAIGVLLYDVVLPSGLETWLNFAWIALLGITSCTLLGIAFSSIPKNGKSAPAIVSPVAILLQFISGVFFVFSQLPTWMQTMAAVFPLKWMTQGMRSVFLPDAAQAAEPAGSWELGRIAVVLAVWCVVGLVLCLMTFRWRSRSDG